MASEDDNEYLHLVENIQIKPSLQTKILISKLWKLCLLHLYGGSLTQKEWSKEIFKAVTINLLDKEANKDEFRSTRDFEREDYIEKSEFTETAEVISLLLKEDGSLEGNYNLLIKDLIKLAVGNGGYDARYRSTIKLMTNALEVDWDEIDDFEKSLVEHLVKIHSDEEGRDQQQQNEQKKKNMKRAFLIGLTAVGGGAILALSAGLAAPLIGAGAVAVLGSGSAAIFTGASGIAVITSIFGAAGAGLTGYKMTKRIGKIDQFEFGSLSNGKHLHMTLAVSGFCSLEDESGFSTPWEALDNSTEQYYLKWEGKYLRKLGSSIIDFVKREAMQAAVKGILKYTALRAVLKSIAWPLTLISAANIIDNPWNVCTQRSKEVGIQLAHVLLSRHQGYRPVTLIGFSLGARVIFYCLQTMLNEKGFQGIVEDVILIGTPVGVNREEWEAFESIVSGSLYNCYSRSDWLLKFVYRAASVQVGDIAGLGPIEVDWPRLVNIDLTEKVNSHSEYADPVIISDILQSIGIKTKPIENPSPTKTLKKPQDIVKEISMTPTKILPNSLVSKDAPQQHEFSPEEQDTLDRLTSCQNKTVIDNLKSGFWKNEDSDSAGSDSGSPNHPRRWMNVFNISKRGSITSLNRGEGNRLMITAGDDQSFEISNVAQDLQIPSSDLRGHKAESMNQSSDTYGSSVLFEGAKDKGQTITLSGAIGSEDRGCNVKRESASFSKDITDLRSDIEMEGKSHGITGQSTFFMHDSSDDQIERLICAVPTQRTSKEADEKNLPETKIRTEENLKEGIGEENKTNQSKFTNKLSTSFLSLHNRRKSAEDVLLTKNTVESKTRFEMPGKGLLNKVKNNVKFTLPSPTLGRRKNDNMKETALDESDRSENVEQTRTTSLLSFKHNVARKLSYPGP